MLRRRNDFASWRIKSGPEMAEKCRPTAEIVRPSYPTLLYLWGSSTLRFDIAIQCNSNNVELITVIWSGEMTRRLERGRSSAKMEMFATINCKNFGIKCPPMLFVIF